MGQRRLTAIMFTDMVGYSALTRENESLALELVEQHNRMLRRRFIEHGGREIKAMGDGFLVVFASALDAVRCAVAVQNAVHTRNAGVSLGNAFHVRIGVHVGDVVHEGDDIFGDGVNIAARVECLARPGGICVSEPVVNLIRHAIPQPLIKLGKAALKNIPAPVSMYYVGLPWNKHPVSLRDRVSFACFHKRKALTAADLTNTAFVAAIAGLMIWQSVVENKTLHALVWFGDGSPAATRPLDTARVATPALAGVVLHQFGTAPSPPALPGADAAFERRSPVAERRGGLAPAPQPPDLLTLMVSRDSGRTFHFARHYDRIRAQLLKTSGSASPDSPDTVLSKHASLQQALFEEVFARTMPPGTPHAAGGAL